MFATVYVKTGLPRTTNPVEGLKNDFLSVVGRQVHASAGDVIVSTNDENRNKRLVFIVAEIVIKEKCGAWKRR